MINRNTQQSEKYDQLQDAIYAKRDELYKLVDTKRGIEESIASKYRELGDLEREATEICRK